MNVAFGCRGRWRPVGLQTGCVDKAGLQKKVGCGPQKLKLRPWQLEWRLVFRPWGLELHVGPRFEVGSSEKGMEFGLVEEGEADRICLDNEVEEVFNETTQFIASSSKQDGGGANDASRLVNCIDCEDYELYESYKDACDLTKEHMEFCKVFDINPRKQIK
ncbi:hypothetical protein Tco_0550708 [Tanacetum coccineum]